MDEVEVEGKGRGECGLAQVTGKEKQWQSFMESITLCRISSAGLKAFVIPFRTARGMMKQGKVWRPSCHFIYIFKQREMKDRDKVVK